jgi:antitoxin (DNA-binding transcriptional repressor) of toxin-antitoxin stability system
VRRAERGERLLITRRGKLVAELTPLDRNLSVRDSSRPRYTQWQRERAAFQRLEPKLGRLRGQFVAVKDGKLIDSDEDVAELLSRVSRAAGGAAFYVGRVGEAEPVVDMPGFELE